MEGSGLTAPHRSLGEDNPNRVGCPTVPKSWRNQSRRKYWVLGEWVYAEAGWDVSASGSGGTGVPMRNSLMGPGDEGWRRWEMELDREGGSDRRCPQSRQRTQAPEASLEFELEEGIGAQVGLGLAGILWDWLGDERWAR